MVSSLVCCFLALDLGATDLPFWFQPCFPELRLGLGLGLAVDLENSDGYQENLQQMYQILDGPGRSTLGLRFCQGGCLYDLDVYTY